MADSGSDGSESSGACGAGVRGVRAPQGTALAPAWVPGREDVEGVAMALHQGWAHAASRQQQESGTHPGIMQVCVR